MTQDMKILTTAQVHELQAKAEQHGFNRQLPGSTLGRLDSEKFHIATLVLFGHERGRENDPLHHRIRLLLGVQGKTDPRNAFLDVADEDWAPLPDAESVRAALRAQGSA